MADDKKPKKARAKKYEEKTAVKGSFLDIMKAAVKDANSKSAQQQNEQDKKDS